MILGQERLRRVLCSTLCEGKPAHAYLLFGPKGSGKKTLAAFLASALVCETLTEAPCGKCRHCRKATEGTNPDIHFIMPEGKYLRIDQVRQVKSAASYRPHESRYQVFIMDAAAVTTEAANSLLKLLEEPPAGTVFILLSENPGLLPPTVVSRCQLLKLEKLSPQDLYKLLRQKPDISDEQRELAVRLSEGIPGRALAAAGPDWQELFREVLLFLKQFGENCDFAAKAAQLAAHKDQVMFVDIMLTLLRDLLALNATGESKCLICSSHLSELTELAAIWPAYRAKKALESLLALLENLQSPVNVRLACEQALRRIKEVS